MTRMYWIYVIIFIFAVLAPDIITKDFYFLPEKRAEELLIFILGIIGFIFFTLRDYQLFVQKRERRRDEKKIRQTTKDLVESYSYIGEVNRKMDVLMNISLGLAEQSNLTKNRQAEIYHSIIDAAKFMLKAECVFLRFIDVKEKSPKKEVKTKDCLCSIKNDLLTAIKETENVRESGEFLWTTSHNEIKNVRCYLIANDYDKPDDKTVEMLRVLASQALFVYSYAGHISAQ